MQNILKLVLKNSIPQLVSVLHYSMWIHLVSFGFFVLLGILPTFSEVMGARPLLPIDFLDRGGFLRRGPSEADRIQDQALDALTRLYDLSPERRGLLEWVKFDYKSLASVPSNGRSSLRDLEAGLQAEIHRKIKAQEDFQTPIDLGSIKGQVQISAHRLDSHLMYNYYRQLESQMGLLSTRVSYYWIMMCKEMYEAHEPSCGLLGVIKSPPGHLEQQRMGQRHIWSPTKRQAQTFLRGKVE